MKKLSQEMIDKIRSEPLTLSYEQIAEKLGVSKTAAARYAKAECKVCIKHFVWFDKDECELGRDLKVCTYFATVPRKRRFDAKQNS